VPATNADPPAITGGNQNRACPQRPPRSTRRVIERAVLLALIAASGVNLWTGGPLFALWVGSRLAGNSGQLTLGIVGITALTLFAVELALYRLLGFLDSLYNASTGGPPQARRRAPWLRSMRDSPRGTGDDQRITAPEAVVIAIFLSAVLAFEIWFFFFAGNSLPRS
jgi:hypothetical protein